MADGGADLLVIDRNPQVIALVIELAAVDPGRVVGPTVDVIVDNDLTAAATKGLAGLDSLTFVIEAAGVLQPGILIAGSRSRCAPTST